MENLSKLFTHEKQFTDIIEALGEGIGFVDEHEKLIYANRAAADLFGTSKEELIGQNLARYVSEEEFRKILDETSRRKEGKVSTYEYELIRQDGTKRRILLTASPRFEDNRFIGSFGIFRDITELNKATSALKESETRFRTVSDIISDFAVSFIVGNEGSLTPEWHTGSLPLANDIGEKESLDPQIWARMCHPDDLAKLQNAHLQLIENKESVFFEYRVIRTDGSVEWLEIYATPEIDKSENRVARIILAGRRVTGTKVIEQQFRLNQYMVEHASECIYLIRPDSSIAYANEAACKLLGYTREELQSKKISQLDPLFKPEKEGIYWQHIRDRKQMFMESQQKKKDNSIITVEITINFLVFENQEYAIAFLRDITERKNDEQIQNAVNRINHLISLTSAIPDLFQILRNELSILLDTSNLYLLLTTPDNSAFSYYYHKNGLTASETVPVLKTLESWILASKKPNLLRVTDLSKLEESGIITKFSTPAKCYLGIPLTTGDKVLGIIALISFENEFAYNERHIKILDLLTSQISLTIHRRQSEEALKVSEARLRDSNVAKDKFFSIIAHDLRGPFNAIIGFSDLLYSDYESLEKSEKKAMIKNIHDASVGTFKLLENLLEWSRIRTGRTVPGPENVDLSTIANSTLGFLKPLAEKKNIKLFSGIHYGTIAYCDENMITTVVRNLIANAIKFTNAGGNVRIWATHNEELIEVTVADNGIGISPENLEKLFRLDESVKTRGTAGEQGTGLGLLLSREFIELNGGRIWAESEPGKGSQFRFTLPRSSN
ncbi:MAG: PAS domain S-box protein [bacterium]